MKFGKHLLTAIEASSSDISQDLWLNYHELKTMLKANLAETDPVKASQGEARFFALVKSELRKVEMKFREMHSEALSAGQTVLNEEIDDLTKHMENCTKAHMKILLVENYAVLNYCGFTKILKKHDKHTKLSTKEKVMTQAVNNLQFSDVHNLSELLVNIEAHFYALKPPRARASSITAQHPQHRSLQGVNKDLPNRLNELATLAIEAAEREFHDSETEELPPPKRAKTDLATESVVEVSKIA